MNVGGFKCQRCHNTTLETGELRAAGSFWTKIFNLQTRKFTTVTCGRCSYTEIYQADSSRLGDVFDFFVGS